MNTVKINGISSDTVRLKFDKIPLIPAAKEKVNTYSIPGAGQDLTIGTEDYSDIQMTLVAYLVGGTTIQEVYDWLHSGEEIILSTQPGVYGLIRQIGEILPSREGWNAHKISIPLTLSPFRYRVQNDPVALEESPAELRTIGNLYSLPVYTLTGCSGDISLTVNGTTLSIENAPDTVIIDMNTQTVFTYVNGEASSILDTTSGEFWNMVLIPGDVPNRIAWSGTIGAVSVTRNERWV